eukprot:scaffold1967_cov175-Prasinococcus_capsulatus_cf.AAC.1
MASDRGGSGAVRPRSCPGRCFPRQTLPLTPSLQGESAFSFSLGVGFVGVLLLGATPAEPGGGLGTGVRKPVASPGPRAR